MRRSSIALALCLTAVACGACEPSSGSAPTTFAAADSAAQATPPIEPSAPAAIEEPRLREEGSLRIWTWSAPDGFYEVRFVGAPWLSDDHAAIEWVNPGQEFVIERTTPAGTIRVCALGADDGKPRLTGHLATAGTPPLASPGELRQELAVMLPRVVAHLGLAVERLEGDVSEGRLERALDRVGLLTSSTAKLAAYEVILSELDDPTVAQRNRLLRHAARMLDGDWFMHQFLLEDMNLTFDEAPLVSATLEAAASIQSDDLCADVLVQLLDLTDQPGKSTVPRVLECATANLQSDAELAAVVRQALWQSLESSAGRRALAVALAALDADGPLRDVLVDLFENGDDHDAAVLVTGLEAARTRIESPELRASALAALPASALHDPSVLAAWEATAASIDACDAQLDLFVALFAQPEADAAVVAAVLRVQHAAFGKDFRTSRLLRAVPSAMLADAQVAKLYGEAAEAMPSPQDRAELLARLEHAGAPSPRDER